MIRAIVFATLSLPIVFAPPAVSEPCEMVNTCRYLPDVPGANGPIQNTWDVPGIPPFTNLPLLCSPFTYKCEAIAP